MVVNGPFLAVDWGTTNRRVFLIENRTMTCVERDARGASVVENFPAEIAAMRARFGDLPMLLAGMVGSNVGWHAVAYVPAPAGLAQLAEALHRVDGSTAIVPGLSFRDGTRADVMRGEEVQMLGAAAAGLVPPDALLCQPGTHCKWARLEAKRVTRFTTAMTGELFALLRTHGLLAGQLGGMVSAGDAFRNGVAEGAGRDLGASLFGIRSGSLLGMRDDADAASFASGLLIGADVAARLCEADCAPVHILADGPLGGLYASAIETLGGASRLVDSEAGFVEGIARIRELTS